MQIAFLCLLIVIYKSHGQDSCEWGKYGENCRKDCPRNCFPNPERNLSHCHKETGKCSEGCAPGWFDDHCDQACSKTCKGSVCNYQNGICTDGCSGNYKGAFCNVTRGTSPTPRETSTDTTPSAFYPETTPSAFYLETTPIKPNTKTTPDLAAILVPVFIILVVVLAVIGIILFLYKRKRIRFNRIMDRVTAILPCWRTTNTSDADNRAGEDEPFLVEQGGAGITTSGRDSDSACSFVFLEDADLLSGPLEQKIKDIQRVFVETESFTKVKEKLARVGHVTISGGAGEGKTSMALMLGAEYRKQGYELVLVEDVTKVKLSDYLDKDVCVIFDDIFQTVTSYMDLSRLKHFLYDLQVHLAQCEAMSERRYQCLHQEPREEQRRLDQPNTKVIFTAETNYLAHAVSKLGGQGIFKSSSYVKVGCTHEEKKEIWLKYKLFYGCKTDVDVNKIIAYEEDTTVAFPLVCKLFSSCVDFQKYNEKFFEKPVFYLEHQLRTLITLLDDKSAALILIVLCEGQLNINHLETEGARPDLKAHLQAVATLVQTSTKLGVAKALGTFSGTLLTEGNITAFSHSIIYDVCAMVVFKIEPELILKHCSIKFLLEHVQDQQDESIPVNEYQLMIPFSEAYSGIIAARMAGAIVSGAFNIYVWHPIWKRREIADKLALMITDPAVMSDTKHNIFHFACFTGNKYILERLVPQCNINRRGLNGWTPLMYTVVSGQMDCFDVLVKNKANIALRDSNNYNLLHLACQHGHTSIVEHIKRALGKHPSDLYLNGRGINDWTPAMCAVISGKKDVLNVFIQQKQKADLTLRDSNNNTVLHLACLYGSRYTVECLLPHTNVNTPGNNGQTPVMCALSSERKETFDLLVSKNANITLTDDDNTRLLHLACKVDDMALVVHILPKFDRNSRGKHGWTPVMTAAVYGREDLCQLLLVTQKVDLEITDDNNNNLLHLACHGGNVSIVKLLLPKFHINSRGINGWTPVMFAAANGVESVFLLLVSQGADITLRDDYNDSVLHLACVGGNSSVVKYILQRIHINCLGNHGRTPIMITALLAKPTLFKLLLSKKANITQTDDYNDNALHHACHGGNNSIVNYMMSKVNINTSGKYGRTPVMVAAKTGRKDVFDLLVRKKADLSLTDDYQDNVLHLACQGGSEAIVNNLVTDFDVNLCGKNGCTPVMHAAKAGQKDVFNLLVTKNAELELFDLSGNNLLHLACQGGNVFIIEYLLPMFDINSPGENGWTPIMMAALSGKKDAYDLIASKGGNRSLSSPQNDNVLHAASQGGNTDIVNTVFDNFGINTRGMDRYTPLMRAVCGGHVAVYTILVAHSADQMVVDKDGHSLLHLACQYGHLHVITCIVGDADIIDSKDKVGLTPVMTSILYDQAAVLKYLRRNGADMSLTDNTGDSAFTLAHKVGSRQIIDQLTPGGASDHNNKPVTKKTKSHVVSDSITVTPWNKLMKSLVRGQMQLLKTYTHNDPELDQRDHFKDTLLHLACRGGNRECVEFLLPSYDINVRGRYDWTPVMMAAVCGHDDVFQLLVSHKADLSLVSDTGEDICVLALRGNSSNISAHCESAK